LSSFHNSWNPRDTEFPKIPHILNLLGILGMFGDFWSFVEILCWIFLLYVPLYNKTLVWWPHWLSPRLLFMELQCENHFCGDGQGFHTCSWSCHHSDGGSHFLELECFEVRWLPILEVTWYILDRSVQTKIPLCSRIIHYCLINKFIYGDWVYNYPLMLQLSHWNNVLWWLKSSLVVPSYQGN
jgi:hypothetical protein